MIGVMRPFVSIVCVARRGSGMRTTSDGVARSNARSAGGGVKVPHVLNLDGIVFARPGPYTFDVTVDGEHHVSIPLSVVDASGAARA